MNNKNNKPESASELIDRLEKETGQRIDSDDGDNLAMAGLIGAISRIMGNSPPTYRERDDVAAGLLIRHRMSPEYQRKQANKQLFAELLSSDVSPDDLKGLSDLLNDK